MYLEHFGLQRQPFKITPDTSLFYKGNKRGAALEALKYAIESGEGIVKVIGEVGSGKTMLCRMLEQELPDHIEIVYIANPSLSPENILPLIAFELQLPVAPDASKLELMQKLQHYLLQKHGENRQVLVLVEEAQSMPLETLEENYCRWFYSASRNWMKNCNKKIYASLKSALPTVSISIPLPRMIYINT